MRGILVLALFGGIAGWVAMYGVLTAGRPVSIPDIWSGTVVVPAANDIGARSPPALDEEVAGDSYERAADRALSLASPGARFVALRSVAREWALDAPAAAMAYGKALANPILRSAFCEEVLGQWWRLDPVAAVAAGAELTPGPLVGAVGVHDPLAAAVAVAPEAALAALEKYPPASRSRVRTLAQRAIVERDPAAARAMAESMLAGQERDRLLGYVAESWVRRDPDAALAWVESLNPPSSSARMALVEGLARVDFDRAVDIALGDDTVSLLVINLPIEQNGDRLPALMDRLLEEPRRLGVASLVANTRRDTVLARWATFDPEGALRWLADRGVTDARLVDVVAGRFVARDAQAAAAAVQRVPGAMRPAWINAVVAGFATTNPPQALSWIEQFRAQQGYDGWVTTIVQTVAGRDPEAAANLLRSGDESARRNTPYVAQRWAERDPVRASQWAVSLAAPDERNAAAAMIAAQWASADAEAARRWALAAPGSMRDAAIAALFERQLGPVGISRDADLTLLDAIGDRATSQRLVRIAVPGLARDPVKARELIDRFVFDPAEKRAALEELERYRP